MELLLGIAGGVALAACVPIAGAVLRAAATPGVGQATRVLGAIGCAAVAIIGCLLASSNWLVAIAGLVAGLFIWLLTRRHHGAAAASAGGGVLLSDAVSPELVVKLREVERALPIATASTHESNERARLDDGRSARSDSTPSGEQTRPDESDAPAATDDPWENPWGPHPGIGSPSTQPANTQMARVRETESDSRASNPLAGDPTRRRAR